MEPVAPADINRVDRALTCTYNLENTLVMSAITPYHLVRHLTAPVMLSGSITVNKKTGSGRHDFFLGGRLHLSEQS